ncbi:MAG: hypothetical protein ABR981_02300 [Candidatus Micrarchaeaceae archaeon]|jgi:hypothetical protein
MKIDKKPLIRSDRKSRENLILGIFALLILVVVIVYLLFFASPGGAITGNACVANSGFSCKNTFYHQNGYIELTLGLNNWTTWTSANFVFVPIGTPSNNGIPKISFISYPANTAYAKNGVKWIEPVDIWLAVNGTTAPVTIGTTATGFIWAQYTLTNNQTPKYVQMATINIKTG